MNTFLRAVLPAFGAAVLVFTFILLRRQPAPEPARLPPPAVDAREVPVLYGRDGEFEVLLRRRYASTTRAAFADRALIEALGGRAEETPPVFVELLIRRTGSDPARRPSALVLRTAGGVSFVPRALEDYLAKDASAQARMLVAAFSSPFDRPIGNGSLRRVVYGLPPGLAFEDVVSGETARVPLALARGSSALLEGVVDEVGSPLSDRLLPGSASTIAEAASSPSGGPESRR